MMSINILTAAGVVLAWAGVASADSTPPGAIKLAHALEGRIAGKAANCLPMRTVRSTRVIDGTAIIFEVGNTLYVNVPDSGAELLSDSKVLVTRTPTSQFCRGEVVSLIDLTSRMQLGSVFLGEFVPYRKAQRQLPQQGSGMSAYSGSGY